MSDEFDGMFDDGEFDTTPEPQQSEGSRLRQYAERTAKENQDLRERVAQFEAKERNTSLAAALSDAGKDPAAAALIPADVGADDVATWLETNGAFIKDKEADQTTEQTPEEVQSPLTDEDAQAQAAVSGAPGGGSAVPPSVSNGALDRLAQATSEAEYDRILAEIKSEERRGLL